MRTQRTIIVIGAGPGGVAAAARVSATSGTRTLLITRGGVARYLPGVLPLIQGSAPLTGYLHSLTTGEVATSSDGWETRAGEVVALGEGRVHLVDGTELSADAIIAAPGLVTNAQAIPQGPRSYPVWEVEQAARAHDAVAALKWGRLVIVVASLPYRCPPAPYGLALTLRAYYAKRNLPVEVTLVTPEPRPLSALGHAASEYLTQMLDVSGVELRTGEAADLPASEDGSLALASGERLPYDLGLFIPPHHVPLWLGAVTAPGSLVQVDEQQRTPQAGLWAVGDVAGTPLPRAAGVADAQGHTAAESVLAAFGLIAPRPPIIPQPTCYVWSGSGQAGQIAITFPDGLPPHGQPQVTLTPPSRALFAEALDGRERWLRSLQGVHR